jgi:hypothetical protein
LISAVARIRFPNETFIAPQPSRPFTAPQWAANVSTERSMNVSPVAGCVPKTAVGVPIL